MKLQTKTGNVFGATLYIISTCVGVGIIGIPIATGVGGFFPALGMNALIAFVVIATGLLYAEVILAFPDGTNLLSAAQSTVGPIVRFIAGFCLIFIYFSLFSAYLFGAGQILSTFLSIPSYFSILILALFFGFFVFMGLWFSSPLNFVLVAALITSYALLIATGSQHVSQKLLFEQNWILIVLSAPLIFLTYAYGFVIPSLVTYVRRNEKKISLAIIIGITIIFFLACTWQGLIMGIFRESTIWQAYESGIPLEESFVLINRFPWLKRWAVFFSFFSIVAAFLGSSFAVTDFFLDGFAVPVQNRNGKKRLAVVLLIYIPPTLFAIFTPHIFLKILQYISGFGEAIINGILPVWMAWIVRYRQELSSKKLLFGGKPLLLFLLFFILFIIYLQGLEGLKV